MAKTNIQRWDVSLIKVHAVMLDLQSVTEENTVELRAA